MMVLVVVVALTIGQLLVGILKSLEAGEYVKLTPKPHEGILSFAFLHRYIAHSIVDVGN
jgi:hypothetical protein